jgi:hypothetical protein
VDPVTNRQIYWTQDERDDKLPIKPFPGHQEYLYHFTDALWRESLVFVPKSRQMYVSTITLAFVMWHCLFIDARRWLISKVTEDEAKELLRDKIRFPYFNLPKWFREIYTATDKPEDRMVFGATKSRILAVAENAAVRELRGGTASGVLIDEAAFQRELPNMWTAAQPMAARIIAVSTPNIGNPGARFMKKMVFEEKDDVR